MAIARCVGTSSSSCAVGVNAECIAQGTDHEMRAVTGGTLCRVRPSLSVFGRGDEGVNNAGTGILMGGAQGAGAKREVCGRRVMNVFELRMSGGRHHKDERD